MSVTRTKAELYDMLHAMREQRRQARLAVKLLWSISGHGQHMHPADLQHCQKVIDEMTRNGEM